MDSPGDLKEQGARLLRTFPALGVITPLRVLGNGFSSIAIETAEGHVFRIGRNTAAAQGYLKEARLLPVLSRYMSVRVPDPQWFVPTSTDFPFGVIGYRKLPGSPLTPQRITQANQAQLARALANFLRGLHQFPIEQAGVLNPNGEAFYVDLRDAVLPALRDALTESEYTNIANWWDAFLSDGEMKRYQPVVQHGDFWYENILVDDAAQSVTGVLDFEAMAIGDSAVDFATLLYLGAAFAAQVVRSYVELGGKPGDNFVHRLQRWWEFREFAGVEYSIRVNDAEELADSVRKIREGAILNPHKLQL